MLIEINSSSRRFKGYLLAKAESAVIVVAMKAL
jgi:hypothetical protein